MIAKRTSQIMKYGQDVIIQIRTDDTIQYGKWYNMGSVINDVYIEYL